MNTISRHSYRADNHLSERRPDSKPAAASKSTDSGPGQPLWEKSDVTLAKLLDQFDVTQNRLYSAVVCDQNDMVAKLDRELSGLFRRILEFNPQTDTDFTACCRFLVGQMLQFDAHSATKEHIADRLIGLIEEYVANRPSQ